VTVSAPDSLLFGQIAPFTATTLDAAGNPLTGRSVIWRSSNAGVATVSPAGEVTVVDTGAFVISAESEGVAGQHQVTGWSLRFTSVSAGEAETCALTPDGNPWCWGRLTGGDVPVPLADNRAYIRIATANGRACGTTTAGEALCWTDPALGATPVPGSPALSLISPALEHTCGLDLGGAALCWGKNTAGRLGTGLIPDSPIPTPVAGGEHYLDLSSGSYHTCAVTLVGAGICWGSNGNGQLGSVAAGLGSSYSPVPVEGGLTYRAIVAGLLHTCALAADSTAYCWGDNSSGTLGNNSTRYSLVPVPVLGGFKASTVALGMFFTCALAPAGSAWCWGNNDAGTLGNGTTASDSVPVPVSGGLSFAQLSVGTGHHACGVTQAGVLYCWGSNANGQLGRPGHGRGNSSVPVKPVGQR
jgi:alpha-tubulin suppressor-like RCC1 family protein